MTTPRVLRVLDSRNKWIAPSAQACKDRGWSHSVLDGMDTEGYGLFFVHAHPQRLLRDREAAVAAVQRGVTPVTDLTQVRLYEDKRSQTELWHDLMPETWIFTDPESAMALDTEYPLVSKADVGASSHNVRIIGTRREYERHVAQVFGPGIEVLHCDGLDSRSIQRGYLLIQRFVPHRFIYRVNVIGSQLAAFRRYNYPDRPVTQTGNVQPVTEVDAEVSDLFAWCQQAFRRIGTKWCAIDVLRDQDDWMLLETSLRWPWPSPGDCDDQGRFWRPTGSAWQETRRWRDMWHVLIDELEAGCWDG